MSRATAVLGLGANTGDREGAIRGALAGLARLPDTRLVAAAPPREWPAEGGPAQPSYLNTAAVLETGLAPEALLAAAWRLEQAAGRRRVEPWGPRTLDVDLIWVGDAVRDTFALRLPHPRLAGRGFCLEPLAEIAPDARHPTLDATVRELRDAWRARRARPATRPVLLDGKAALVAWRAGVRAAGCSLGFVPTMGALHAGHQSLMRVAHDEHDRVLASVFVNPLQFGPAEDLARYPRTLDADLARCAEAGVDAVVTYRDADMYPPGFQTHVTVEQASAPLCGKVRPGHFRGVATVVSKLLIQAAPEAAYFGAKDFQQTVVIRRLVADLDLPVAIGVLPTVREDDGLALSSRNAYLSPAEREAGLALSRALRGAAQQVADGERSADRVRDRLRAALAAPGVQPQYGEVVDGDTLADVARIEGPVVAVVAAHVGKTRLIDNLPLVPPPAP